MLVAFWGCKTTQTSTTAGSSYEEDLSVHRPPLQWQQENTPEQLPAMATALPTGHLRAELDTLSSIIAANNSLPRTENGYTIQLYGGPSRESATKVIADFGVKFPEIKTEMTYFQPDFKVKAGKFVDRITAYETFEQVKVEFPDALLVPEKVKINYD